MGLVSGKERNISLLENGTLIAEHWTTCRECRLADKDDVHYCAIAEQLFTERRWIEWKPQTTRIQ